MKRIILLLTLFLFLALAQVSSYKILYAEQYYKLYHQNLYQYPEDFNGNIWYLERALSRPFVNPLNALTIIENQDVWERYRYLFYLHVNLKLIEQYRHLGSKYDKRVAYFFNEPWKEANLKSLDIAESYYIAAEYYWREALLWIDKLKDVEYFFLTDIQNWEDERFRIVTGDLDYEEILGMDLAKLKKVRADYMAMDENTY
ncbi:MAG: hypothetical protein KAQ93_08660 [Spirochaetales bacterium]|nr:hypothetical protein [Spirochaetales bacterium]